MKLFQVYIRMPMDKKYERKAMAYVKIIHMIGREMYLQRIQEELVVRIL